MDGQSPMDCDDALLRVYEYLDGELTVWRRRAITRHLDECPPCANGFAFEVELRRIVVSKCREEVPPSSGCGSPRRSGSSRTSPDRPRIPAAYPSAGAAAFYDDGSRAVSSRGGMVRPSEIMMLVARRHHRLVGLVLGIGVLVDHTGGKFWFYWIAPLLMIGLGAAADQAGGRLLHEGRAARDQGSPA